MAVMLERWNDERMDDLAAKVDGLGVRLDEHRREQHEEILELRREMRGEMQAGFDRLGEEMLELRRGIRAGVISVSSSAIVGFAALIATQL